MRRRELLLAAAGLLVAPAAAGAAPPTEGAVVLGLMTAEQRAKLAYAAAIKAGAPSDFTAIRANESDHADALATELAAIGLGRPLPPKLEGASAKLAQATGRSALVESAIAMEDDLVDAYVQALPHLQDPKIAMTAATILASHAQHRLILGFAAS